MLTITDTAAEHLCSLLEDAEAPENVVARILVDGDGLALKIDQPRAEDDTFDHHGRTVLALDKQASDLLSNDTLDVKLTEAGPKLFSRGHSS